MEHLHGRLASLRDELGVVSRERDQLQLQLKMLQELQAEPFEVPKEPQVTQVAAPQPQLAPLTQPTLELQELRSQVRELQSLVALKDRELQVFHWRSQAESNGIKAQEQLMSACFHDLGLRYHQLQVQNDMLLKRLRD